MFDGQNFNQLWTHSLGDDADNIRRDSSTGHMLVGYGSGGIAVFDADGKQLADTKLDAHPESFQLESAGSRIFVNLPQSHKIAVIDRSSSRAVATWATDGASANFPMALDQADNRILVVCRNPAVLLVIDAASGRIIQKLPTVGDSDDLFYDSTLRRIYVSGGEGAISIYQQEGADRYSPIAQLTTTSGARTSLFVPSLNRLFLAVREHEGKTAAIEVFAVGK